MGKSKCLRAFAEITTLRPEIGFSCQGQRLAACIHKRAPWAPVCACRVVSTGFAGLSLVVWGQLVCGAVLAIQGQPESHKSNAKLNDFLSCISEYCICDSWGVLIWSFFFFFGKMRSWQPQFPPSRFLYPYWSMQLERLRNDLCSISGPWTKSCKFSADSVACHSVHYCLVSSTQKPLFPFLPHVHLAVI